MIWNPAFLAVSDSAGLQIAYFATLLARLERQNGTAKTETEKMPSLHAQLITLPLPSAGQSHMAQMPPIALRALPQQSWGRHVETTPSAIDVEWVEGAFSVVVREEDRLGFPQLVGEVPEGRWGPLQSYAIALLPSGRGQGQVEHQANQETK